MENFTKFSVNAVSVGLINSEVNLLDSFDYFQFTKKFIWLNKVVYQYHIIPKYPQNNLNYTLVRRYTNADTYVKRESGE